MDRLKGVRLKIERAKKHIGDLDVAIRTFCDSEPYTLRTENVPKISHIALYVDSVKPIPDEISAIIGDTVHNLRSALDHLAWQLVEANGGTPGKDTYFPVCENDLQKGPQQYASAIGKGEIKQIHPEAQKLISRVQPYITRDSTLWHIHELDRIDKHRLVLTVTMQTNAWGVDIIGNTFMFPVGIIGQPLHAGYEVMRLPDTKQGQNLKLGLDITFGQSEIVAGKSVLETLHEMANLVSHLVPKFEPFLS